MDYTGIIQLVIATIFYSTLVAPNLKRMSDLRSEISDMDFPLKSDQDYKILSSKFGTSINKKMKQYNAVYNETRKFLRFLYGAMAIALISQIVSVVYQWCAHKQFQGEVVLSIAITLSIVVLLVIAMNIFIVKPEKIRTFEWLTSIGIAPTYSHDIFNPSLQINRLPMNLRESNNHVDIELSSDIVLYGYNIILTIEDTGGEKLYNVVAGRIQKEKYIKTRANYYNDGRTQAILNIIHSLRLKPGAYKVRLLVFETVFPGTRAATEVTGGFTVTETDAQESKIDIDLSITSQNYSFKSEKDRPRSIEFKDDFPAGNAIRTLLAEKRFRKQFEKSKILFCLEDVNGMLTSDAIHRSMFRGRIFLRRIQLFLTRKRSLKIRRTSHLKLT